MAYWLQLFLYLKGISKQKNKIFEKYSQRRNNFMVERLVKPVF